MIAFNRGSRNARRRAGGSTDPLNLATGNPPAVWLAGLVVAWPEVDESRFTLTCAALGGLLVLPEWLEFAAAAVSQGLAEWTDANRTALVFHAEWRDRMELQLEQYGDPDGILRRLVVHWIAHPDDGTVEQVVLLARRLELWRELETIWVHHLHAPDRRGLAKVIAPYRTIPEEARRTSPMLTWASAVAAMFKGRGRAGPCPLTRLLIRDALALHSQWHLQELPDARVLGGTMWMAARWLLPSERPAESVEVAWRTRMAIKDVISRSELVGGPTPLTQVIFRTFSAQLALARSDPQTASAEARQAGILGDGVAGLRSLAKGVEVLSGCLLGVSTGPRRPPPPPRASPVPGLGDFRETGIAMLGLASGLSALDRLDRDGVAIALDSVPAAEVAGAGLWSIRAQLAAIHGALWGELTPTLEQLDAIAATFTCTVAEDAEPLGRRLVGNARVVLLNMLGATDAARDATDFLPEDSRWLARARTHLWAGEIDEAVHAAVAGLVDARTWPRERAHLLATKAAALCLDPAADEGAQRAAARAAVTRCWSTQNLLAVALLPASARGALLDTFEAGASTRDRAISAQIRSRIAHLASGVERDLVRIKLTRREQVLLPLLATAEPVPDIARQLHLSTNTVRKQVVTLRAKFHAATRAELVRSAREAGFLH